jgi:hypothetical protein
MNFRFIKRATKNATRLHFHLRYTLNFSVTQQLLIW